jgi:hypothetical protein
MQSNEDIWLDIRKLEEAEIKKAGLENGCDS